jgi:hypothetical protein
MTNMTKEGMNYCYGSWTINVPSLTKNYNSKGYSDLSSSRMHLFDDCRTAIQRYLESVI